MGAPSILRLCDSSQATSRAHPHRRTCARPCGWSRPSHIAVRSFALATPCGFGSAEPRPERDCEFVISRYQKFYGTPWAAAGPASSCAGGFRALVGHRVGRAPAGAGRGSPRDGAQAGAARMDSRSGRRSRWRSPWRRGHASRAAGVPWWRPELEAVAPCPGGPPGCFSATHSAPLTGARCRALRPPAPARAGTVLSPVAG